MVVVGQIALERISSQGEMCSDGSRGDPEDQRSVVGIEIQQDPQDDHLSLPGGEPVESRDDARIDSLCRGRLRNAVDPEKW